MTTRTVGHTPTPWKVEALSVFGPHDEKGALAPVACCDVKWDGQVIRPYAEVVGNTAFIVRACNAHDGLLAACKGLAAKLERSGEAWMSDPDWLAASAAIAKADA